MGGINRPAIVEKGVRGESGVCTAWMGDQHEAVSLNNVRNGVTGTQSAERRPSLRGTGRPRRTVYPSPKLFGGGVMNRGLFGAFALSVAAALLAACGGSQVPSMGSAVALDATSGQRTFKYTGAKQEFTVPAHVTQIEVFAHGGNGAGSSGSTAGYGGRVHAQLPVKPGEKLVIYVGGNASAEGGGYNGGGNGGGGQCHGGCTGYGGGGASDIRRGGGRPNDRILVVGGGGGQGGTVYSYAGGNGGKGGGTIGGPGGAGGYGCSGYGGGGGTQYTGGDGGAPGSCFVGSGYSGTSGGIGTGGDGGGGNGDSGFDGGGGGGGSGYYGGGGGGGGSSYSTAGSGGGGGGGGGSSYVESSATDVHFWRGWKSKGGLVVIHW